MLLHLKLFKKISINGLNTWRHSCIQQALQIHGVRWKAINYKRVKLWLNLLANNTRTTHRKELSNLDKPTCELCLAWFSRKSEHSGLPSKFEMLRKAIDLSSDASISHWGEILHRCGCYKVFRAWKSAVTRPNLMKPSNARSGYYVWYLNLSYRFWQENCQCAMCQGDVLILPLWVKNWLIPEQPFVILDVMYCKLIPGFNSQKP